MITVTFAEDDFTETITVSDDPVQARSDLAEDLRASATKDFMREVLHWFDNFRDDELFEDVDGGTWSWTTD